MSRTQVWAGRLLITWQAVILALGALGLAMWLPRIGRPFPGILYKYQRERASVFVYFETGAGFPGIEAGLQINDRIVSVNGLAGTQQGIDEAVRQAAMAPEGEQILVYDVERRGQRLTVSVPLTRLSLNQLLDAKLPLTVLGLSYLLLAFLVFRARPTERVNQLFAVFCTLVASASLSIGYAGLVGRLPFPSTVPDLVLWEPSVPFGCAVLWHFFAVFPEGVARSWVYRLRRAGYLPAALLALFFGYQQLFPEHPPTAGLSLVVSIATLAWLATVILVGFWRLARAYRRRPPERVRRQIAAILIGGCLGLLPSLIPLFAFILSQNLGLLLGNNLFYMGLLFPLAVAYAILQYDLFRLKSAILASFILAGFSVVVANGFYYLFNFLLNWPVAFLPLLLACLLTGIAWEVRSPVRRLFERLFLRAAYDYRALSRFSEVLLSVPHEAVTYDDLCRVLAEQLGLAQVSLWIVDHESRGLWQATGHGADPPASLPLPESGAPELNIPLAQPVRALDVEAQPWTRLLPDVPAAVYVPLADRDTLLGVLAVGQRWNEEPLDDEDLSLLALMGRQLSLALLAIQQTDELRQVPGRIAQAQEEERYELSKDLHDTVQQFLGGLPFFLETAKRAAAQAPNQTARLLDDCQDLAQRASQDLRAIRGRLSPGPLEGRGLASALQGLVEVIPRAGHPLVRLDADADLDHGLTSSVKIALFRVIQQALDNALAHAQAQHVELRLRRSDGRVEFAIADDGCGFDPDLALQAAGQGGHDGLWIMRDRIEIAGGELAIESAPGQGTAIRGWVPVTDPLARGT